VDIGRSAVDVRPGLAISVGRGIAAGTSREREMASRDYLGDGITVHWDSERCLHSGRCTNGLPAVFDTSKRPWIGPKGATADDTAAVIDTCPSGALSYTRTDGAPNGRRGRAVGEDPAASIAVDPDWNP